MNRLFRTLWNPALGAWVAAPETARGPARSAGAGASGAYRPAALCGLHAIAIAVLCLGASAALAAGGAQAKHRDGDGVQPA